MNKEQQRAQPGGYPYQRKDKQNNMVAAPFKVRNAYQDSQPEGCAYQSYQGKDKQSKRVAAGFSLQNAIKIVVRRSIQLGM